MERLSNNQEDHPNHHKNSHKACSEMGHPVFSLLESQWKLRVTVRDLSRRVNYLSKTVWGRKIITGRLASPILDTKVPKVKHISRRVDQENLIYVR